MRRKVLSILTLATLSPVMAQQTGSTTKGIQTSTAESKTVFQKLKDSGLGFNFNLATDIKRNDKKDNKVDGFDQTNRFYLSYKLSPKDRLRAEIRTTHSKLSGADMENSVDRTVLKYSRSALLNQTTHGVDLSASVEYRYLPNKNIRNTNHRYSHVRLGPTVAKAWGDFAADAGIFYAFNQTRNSDKLDRQTNNWDLPLSQSLNITEKLKASLVEELFYANTASNTSEKLTLDISAEAGYQFTNDFYVGLSATGRPVSRTDGTEAKGWVKEYTYGINFDVAVF